MCVPLKSLQGPSGRLKESEWNQKAKTEEEQEQEEGKEAMSQAIFCLFYLSFYFSVMRLSPRPP